MIDELTYVLQQIADGNVSFCINHKYVGEFIAIKDALNTILKEDNKDYSEINQAAGSVSDASEQLRTLSTRQGSSCNKGFYMI